MGTGSACIYFLLGYNKIDVSEGINVNKTNGSKEYHYCYFLDKSFNFELYLCNGCHKWLNAKSYEL